MGLAEQKIEKLKKDLKSLKAKIDEMQAKKAKDPINFSYLEKMQLQSNIAMYNEQVAKVKAIKEGGVPL